MTACETCTQREATHLVDFKDGGPVFEVCRPCAQDAADWGGRVVVADVSMPVMPGQLTLDGGAWCR